ncbi:helix-turn-helix transcriptional regulator [Ramlibacter sp. 2FC]|uniref:AraC family transcriptional regulator n=1 Tax=Ramlibacter sp. 2FC TaxID=2502188 RepID=UPI0010F9B20B|nr:helix-turn-helix transcriptional regulator [Ramlibacter sp. 2FC]
MPRTRAQATQLRQPPFTDALPSPIYFRAARMPADASYPRHRHRWGEFVHSFSGVMEVQLQQGHYLIPPQYGLWLPPDVEHRGLNRQEAVHCSLYVAPELTGRLPRQVCALTVGPLLRALLDELRQHPPSLPRTPAQERLLQVLLDQLERAEPAGSYLPASDDALLAPVLQALEAQPGDERSVAGWAAFVHTTERTLMRRCQSELGMTLSEWRQRLRVVKAMPLLAAGQTVEAIAQDLGYASTSAFIAMFRRLMGVTPDEYRRGARAGR